MREIRKNIGGGAFGKLLILSFEDNGWRCILWQEQADQSRIIRKKVLSD